jgi:hypothetical protein
MPHVYLISGELTAGGSVGSKHIDLTVVQNVNVIGTLHLNYIVKRTLTLTHITNANVIEPLTLSHIVVRTLTPTHITNANTIGSLVLAQLPFVPANTETTDLLNFFDEVYTTTDKLQIDALITALKDAGVWTKFDWYGNARWARSEHDALVNWKNVAQTLTKVGSASWTMNVGLNGVNPVISNSRYKSGWNVGDGAHSSATNFAFFTKITAIAAPQDGMQPMGVWKRFSGGGPSTPDGAFLSLSIVSNSGFAGAFLMNGNGNTSFAPGSGIGVWGVSHNGASQITVKDGVTQETDVVSGSADYTDPDGMSVAGSAGIAKRSFPGTEIYWGWGGALTASEFIAIESAYTAALLPPNPVLDALIVDGSGDYLIVDGSGNYLKVES